MNPDRMRRVNALAQLASDQAGTPEGENAQRALVGLLDGLGLSADDAEIVIRPAEVAATAATLFVQDLARLTADVTGTAYSVCSAGREVSFKGLRFAVDEAVRIFEEEQGALAQLLLIAGAGFCAGRFGLARTQSLAGEAEAVDARKVLQSSTSLDGAQIEQIAAFTCTLGGSAAVEFRGTPVT